MGSVDKDRFETQAERTEESSESWKIVEIPVSEIDSRDVGTPDDWIKRHPSLVRLTGRHPLNCEPPLSDLVSHGFITPTSLHFVRNHGLVPRAPIEAGDDWTVEIGGLVSEPQTLSVGQIKSLPSRTLPVTLVCAGNRRKEENSIKQTIGFSWGAAAVSTSVWKGILLSDILKICGIFPRSKGALYVCFEGAEDLPGGGGSKYGTSLKREVAMNPSNDVILAYEQNGKPLEPDHGFPIRMIIPGFIGGRMVKWLKKIEVTSKESNNFYHFHDNRVLPSHVDTEKAKSEGWWYKPSYIINELNINSCISTPSHGQTITLNPSKSEEIITFEGYAYTGGGREIIRVELSLDDGLTWRLADLTFHESPTEYGKYWCWIFWSLKLNLKEIENAEEIVCRAWDSSQNTQPQFLTWNVMGMMNNCWFRVKVHSSERENGEKEIHFEHPTRPGNESGGWMERKGEIEAQRPRKSLPKLVEKTKISKETEEAKILQPALREFTTEEIRKHNNENSAWIIVNEKVYDCTKFLKDHPGGSQSILMNAGTDSTDDFLAIHSSKAHNLLEDYFIGYLAKKHPLIDSKVSSPLEIKPLATLDPKKIISLPLTEKEELSHDTRRLRFSLLSKDHILGLPVGKHVVVCASIGGNEVKRAYTPTSSDSEKGYFDLVVKIYFKTGVMSQYLDSLKVGEEIKVRGPSGQIEYKGNGKFLIGGKERSCKRVVLLAGGTGITPVYQIMKAVILDEKDKTEIWLLYANRTEQDILLRGELDSWAKNSKVHIWYTLDVAPSEDWKYSTGFINEDMLKNHISPPGDETFAFICGPPGMVKFACVPNLEKLGYKQENIFTF